MDHTAILSHPKKEEIIEKLVKGTSTPKDVALWLKMEYPEKDQVHLRLPAKLLEEYCENYLDIYSQMSKDIEAAKNGGQVSKELAKSVLNNKTYQQRINEELENDLNVKQLLARHILMMNARAEQVFDIIQANPERIGKQEYALQKWFKDTVDSLEKYHKIFNTPTEQSVQANITIQVLENYSDAIVEVIREVFAELEPERVGLIMTKLSEKLSNARPPEMKTLKQRVMDAKVLESELVGQLDSGESYDSDS